ncbi:hypothetical protein CWB72_19935 [Pseudoalteromonas phenolica]|nr:hypothetical protein CWB72_19935 [Pseudoalteromonas phenolica]
MKLIFGIALSVLLTGCMNVNTIEAVKASGTVNVVASNSSTTEVEEAIFNYFQKCYKSSSVKMDGNNYGETLSVSKQKKSGVTEIIVKNILYKGPHHFLIVSIASENGATNITSYAATSRGESAFEKISEIAKGISPDKCPGSIL